MSYNTFRYTVRRVAGGFRIVDRETGARSAARFQSYDTARYWRIQLNSNTVTLDELR